MVVPEVARQLFMKIRLLQLTSTPRHQLLEY